MLRGYRGALLAAFGCLILVGAANSAVEPSRVTERQRANTGHQPASPGNQADQRRRATPDAGTQQEGANAVRARQREDASDKHDADDLIEQRRAADAATNSANLLRFQTWIGVGGFLLLIGTLWAQIAATIAATRAVKAQIAIERGRLYFAVDGCNEADEVSTRFAVRFGNSGKTGVVVTHHCVVSQASPDYARYQKRQKKFKSDAVVIGGGDEFGIHWVDVPTATVARRYFCGEIRYVTPIDGCTYRDFFCIRLLGADTIEDGQMDSEFLIEGWPDEIKERRQRKWPWQRKGHQLTP